jgi:hypothetical protein
MAGLAPAVTLWTSAPPNPEAPGLAVFGIPAMTGEQ